MNLKSIAEVAASLAGVVSTSLELQRRFSDHQLNTRGHRLRARAEELTKFLQSQTQLHGGSDEQLTQQAISTTKTELDEVLQELVRVRGAAGAIKVDEMQPIRRWLLLFVPARPFVWVVHFGFYFSVCWVVLSVFEFKEVTASQILQPGFYVFMICAVAANAVLLRFWALMEKRWAEGFRPTPSSMRQRLLWYRPASRRELIARAGLLFGLYQIVEFFMLAPSQTPLRQAFSYIYFPLTLIVFYAWSTAELSLANNPVDMKFPHNLRFLRWPRNQIGWFWMICFYFMVANTVYLIWDVATIPAANLFPAFFGHGKFMDIAAIIGLTIGFSLSSLLPMYALNRIMLAQSEQKTRPSVTE